MLQTKKPSRLLSFFGSTAVAGGDSGEGLSKAGDPPELKLETDKEVYRPGDLVNISLEIKNVNQSNSLLIQKLSFDIRGIEKLDTTWFNTPKPPESKQRRGEYVFMECSLPTIDSNKSVAAGVTKKYVFRTLLPSIIPPSYRGATIRYLYYVRSTLSGQYLASEKGHFNNASTRDLPELEARIPLQIWVTQKNSGLLSDEVKSDGIVPGATVYLEAYWKEMDGESEWVRANEAFDGAEEGYDSSRDEISSVSSYNPMKGDLHKAFGSALSLQSTMARSSSRDLSYVEGLNNLSSHPALPRLSVAEIVHDSGEGNHSPSKSTAVASPSQLLVHTRSLSLGDDASVPSSPGTFEPGPSEGFIRGRSYNIRLDDQVLLRFSPKNSDSTYYFSDTIGGTLTFFHEDAARRCLELSVTLEMNETISKRFVHPSRRHSPVMTKVLCDHHQVVADLQQTSFLFSIPMNGPMSFSTQYISVQWVLRFEFFTTPKNVEWTRFEHPLLVDGRDKFEWLLPITVHAPPGTGTGTGTAASATQIRNEKSFSLDSLWGQT